MIYLDNASTTPIHEEVMKEMLPYLNERYGNPSSLHKLGREANNGLLLARKRIRDALKIDSRVIFVSGATEANNLALKGVMHANREKGKHIIVSSIEHESILATCKSLEREGFNVSYIPVNRDGIIDLDLFEKMINDETVMVSVMLANNETGVIQPLKEVIEVAHKNDLIIHSDVVQATGKIEFDAKELDLITLSAHKMYGPKGVGALCIRDGIKIEPIVDGGGQEFNLRSGTQNVPAIVGMGKAFEISKNFDYGRVRELRDHLMDQLLSIPNTKLNGSLYRLPNNINITFLGVSGEDLIIRLSEKGIAASTGAACSVNKQKASHVLKAMNLNYEEINGSLRLTLGIQNTMEEMDIAAKIISDTVKELRRVSPYASKYL